MRYELQYYEPSVAVGSRDNQHLLPVTTLSAGTAHSRTCCSSTATCSKTQNLYRIRYPSMDLGEGGEPTVPTLGTASNGSESRAPIFALSLETFAVNVYRCKRLFGELCRIWMKFLSGKDGDIWRNKARQCKTKQMMLILAAMVRIAARRCRLCTSRSADVYPI